MAFVNQKNLTEPATANQTRFLGELYVKRGMIVPPDLHQMCRGECSAVIQDFLAKIAIKEEAERKSAKEAQERLDKEAWEAEKMRQEIRRKDYEEQQALAILRQEETHYILTQAQIEAANSNNLTNAPKIVPNNAIPITIPINLSLQWVLDFKALLDNPKDRKVMQAVKVLNDLVKACKEKHGI